MKWWNFPWKYHENDDKLNPVNPRHPAKEAKANMDNMGQVQLALCEALPDSTGRPPTGRGLWLGPSLGWQGWQGCGPKAMTKLLEESLTIAIAISLRQQKIILKKQSTFEARRHHLTSGGWTTSVWSRLQAFFWSLLISRSWYDMAQLARCLARIARQTNKSSHSHRYSSYCNFLVTEIGFYRATLPCRILWQQARAFEASEVRLLDELVLFTHRTVDLQPQTCRRRAGRRPVHNAAQAQQFWLSNCTANMAEYLSFGMFRQGATETLVQAKEWLLRYTGSCTIPTSNALVGRWLPCKTMQNAKKLVFFGGFGKDKHLYHQQNDVQHCSVVRCDAEPWQKLLVVVGTEGLT